MKRLILAFGVLGLLGCFLPIGHGLSLFDLRVFDWHVWLVVFAFAMPTYVGLSKTEGDLAASLVGTISFGYLFYRFFGHVFDLAFHGSIGGLCIAVATVLGLASSLLALATTATSDN
jgi:hypothetical protein